jgi:hypothetical protein
MLRQVQFTTRLRVVGMIAWTRADRSHAVPGKLPIEQPRVEFVIELKAARVPGPTIPKELLLQVDEVIA